jgi:hypothetical protein
VSLILIDHISVYLQINMSDSADDLGHPDSAIRLASCVHRFRVPRMPDTRLSKSLSYAKSFNTTGQYPKTRQTMLKADTCRSNLMEALQSKYVSHARVVQEAKRYVPLVHQVLLSCKIQPEGARLDGMFKPLKSSLSSLLIQSLMRSFFAAPFD